MDVDLQEQYGDDEPARMSEDYDDALEAVADWIDVHDEASADRLLDRVFGEATDAEYDEIAAEYLGVPWGTSGGPAAYSTIARAAPPSPSGAVPGFGVEWSQGGGGAAHDAMWDFFAYVDSLHDFNCIPPEGRVQRGPTVPIDQIYKALGNPKLPAGVTLDECRSFLAFSSRMQGLRDLDFGTAGTIPNPLFGMNVNTAYAFPARREVDLVTGQRAVFVGDLDECLPAQRSHDAIRRALKLAPHSVICRFDGKKKVLQLMQIAGLCSRMKAKLGATATYIVDDSDEQLMRLLTATREMDAAFFRKYTLEPRTGFVKQLRAMIGPVEWDVAVCDANVMDADVTGFRKAVRGEPTGPVFRRGYPVQATLGGVSPVPVTRESTFGLDIAGDRTGRFSVHDVDASTRAVAAACNERITNSPGLSIAPLLARKRACDWGQIQHCWRYARRENRPFVFVSSDVTASCYSLSREVPVLHLRRLAYHDGAGNPLFHQLTFNIGGVDARVSQAGGSRASVGVSIAAVAVMVASLFLA